ncbi:MAG TPA: hypothetical protein VIU11_17650 [Nakamurella sp.]
MLHTKAGPRGRTAESSNRDGYPATGVAAVLPTAESIEVTDAEFDKALKRIRTAVSRQQAVHEFAQFCAGAGHWWESYREERARWIAALTVATAKRVQADPAEVLALIEDAGEVPWERPPRAFWVADVDAIFERRSRA